MSTVGDLDFNAVHRRWELRVRCQCCGCSDGGIAPVRGVGYRLASDQGHAEYEPRAAAGRFAHLDGAMMGLRNLRDDGQP